MIKNHVSDDIVDITLIRPPVCVPKTTVALRDGLPSISLAALSASLKKANMTVEVIDAFIEGHDQVRSDDENILNIFGLGIEEIIERVPENTRSIGLTLMYSHEHFYTMKLIKGLVRKFPKAKIILGGEHTTFFYEELFAECPQIFACVLGEGDVTIVELLKNFKEDTLNLRDVNGIVYVENGTIKKTNSRERIKDLSSLPLNDWDGCNIEGYLDNKISLASMGKRVIPILGSRGCPYKCTFCSMEQFWGNLWSSRPVNEVVDEIEGYIKKYKIDAVEFYDPSLVVNKKWISLFAKELLERNINVSWEMPIGTRAESFDREILVTLKKSGLSRLNYAPESGSQKVIKDMQKKCSPQKILSSMKEAVDVGIFVRAHMIMGSPTQDFKDYLHDLKFITKAAWVGIHDISMFPYVVFPGTHIYNELLKKGVFNSVEYRKTIKVNSTSNPKGSFNWNKNFSKKIIYQLSFFGMGYFYFLQYLFRPWRFFWLITNYFNKRSVNAIDRYIYYALNRKKRILKSVPSK